MLCEPDAMHNKHFRAGILSMMNPLHLKHKHNECSLEIRAPPECPPKALQFFYKNKKMSSCSHSLHEESKL